MRQMCHNEIPSDSLDQETIPALYKALVRPRLEYAVKAWSPNWRHSEIGKSGHYTERHLAF